MSWGANLDAVAVELGRLSLEGAVVALLVAAMVALFGVRLPARFRYALWLLVPIRLLLAFSFESRLSLFNFSPRVELPPLHRMTVELPPPQYDISPDQMTRAPLPASPAAIAVRASASMWAAGVVLLGGYLARQYWLLRRKVVAGNSVGNTQLLAMFEEARQLLGVRDCSLHEIAGIRTPALFGRKVLIPRETQSSRAELRCAMVHELVHLKRRDHWTNALLVLLQILHWFNPFVWFAFARVRAEMEQTCDERAIELLGRGSRQLYCEALLNLVSGGGEKNGLLAFSMIARPGEIKQRIENLARNPLNKWVNAVGYALLTAFTLFLLTDRRVRANSLGISGVVLDDTTGRPVPDFTVETRHNVRLAKRSLDDVIHLAYHHRQKGRLPGEFQVNMKTPPGEMLTAELRFNAPGYEEFSSVFEKKQLPSHVTVRMHRKN